MTTARPWKALWKYDTHKIKRDQDGRIIGPVTMDFDDYLYALQAVNAHEALVEALESALNLEQAAYLGSNCAVLKGFDVAYHFDKIKAALRLAKGQADANGFYTARIIDGSDHA